MLTPPRFPEIPKSVPISPTKPDDYGFAVQEQVLQTLPIGGAGASYTPPLSLVQVDTENVKVSFGQVNGITPTDVNTNIDVSGSNSTWAIYLHATLGSDGIPTAVEVLSDSAGSVPSNDSDDAYILVGQVTVSGDVIASINTSLAWSQSFVACGRDPADPTTTPGTYYWVVA